MTESSELSWLFSRLQAYYGNDAEKIQQGFYSERAVTLRANCIKTNISAVKDTLSACGISFCPVNWYSDALVINGVRESALQETELYQRGEIYLQSLSSMLPPIYVYPQAEESILDMTAAPGGKTTQMSAMTQGQAFITACEKDKFRVERLRYNVQKQGAPRVSVLCTDAEKLDDFMKFDKILLDAPCSGSGTLNLNGKIKISEKLVSNCVQLQKRLLTKALKLLKKGGTIVYSTCSVLPCENDEVVKSILSKNTEFVPLQKFDGIDYLPSMEGTLCICPNELYEGFYVAKIKKIS